MDIAIDASTLHPSTRLALAALEWLETLSEPENILEIGCGNGILSLTAAQLWQARILACDISENAVADTTKNVAEYAPGRDISVIRSDGLKHPQIRAQAPYGLIIANLLAPWQVQMATEIKKCLAEGGNILFSGILAWQQEGLIEALKAIDIHIIQLFSENEWQCVIGCHHPYK